MIHDYMTDTLITVMMITYYQFKQNKKVFLFTVTYTLQIRVGGSVNVILFSQSIWFLIIIAFQVEQLDQLTHIKEQLAGLL